MSLQIHPTFERDFQKKLRIATIIILCCVLSIFFRLWYLQVLKHNIYKRLSISNRVRVTAIAAPRGIVWDRNGEQLANNIPSFDLTLTPQDTSDTDVVLKKLSNLLKEDLSVLKLKTNEYKNRPPFEPIILKQQLSWNEVSLILANKLELQGINIEVIPKRNYCLRNKAAHILGYLGEINRDELRTDLYRGYSPGDLIGKYGIEKWGEKILRGRKGGLQTEVDASGHRKKILAEIYPIPGSDIVLSIDSKLQIIAENMLSKMTGAVVAMDPQKGDILVMASSPSFDPNMFSRGIQENQWNELIHNTSHPLLNRTLQSQQPPGSIFKVIVAIAALEEGIVDPNKEVFCNGKFRLGRRTFNCWKKSGHGWVNLRKAIVESCDVYFYKLGLRLGIEKIAEYAKAFGLGEKTGIEFGDEKTGLVPTKKWKKRKFKIPWQKGETLNTAIGQGFLLATPIQIADTFCGIANGGMIPRPRIVLKIITKDKITVNTPQIRRSFPVSERTIKFIKDALTGVVNDPKGTGVRSKLDGIIVAGKTGTAQVISKNVFSKNKMPAILKDHAWFVAFAPPENPQIVVSVLCEHGGNGGTVAAPIAKEIIRAFFRNNRTLLN